MGRFFARGVPMLPVVTPREYLEAVDRALDSLSGEPCGAAYEDGLKDLVGGRPVRAACVFSALLERRPGDPTLHRMLGISYLRASDARLGARHLEIALMLLGRAAAAAPGISLYRSLQIEFEASVVRLALTAAYERLGHRAGMIRCLLTQNHPLAWDIHSRPRV